MDFPPDTPVILGTSTPGLMISWSLSRAGVRHVLVGGPEPEEKPRLGESLQECAGPELWRHFGGEFADCFYPKNHISLLNGAYPHIVLFDDPFRTVERMAPLADPSRKVTFRTAASTLLHLDRSRFDPLLYRRAVREPCCRLLLGRVTEVEHEGESDRVTRVHLEGGRALESPGYVFDTLAFHSPVARAARLETTVTSVPQRVVWRHYRAEEVPAEALRGRPSPELGKRRWWLHGTNLLRPYREADGLEGISWLICLGKAVSCGVSLDAESPEGRELEAEQVLARLEAAWARRGVDLVSRFPEKTAPDDFRHAYFVRERAWGRNWLLAGGSFAQFWYPGSLGLWTAAAVSGSAPELLQAPERIGRWYEAAMRRCLLTHESWDAMIHSPPFTRREEPYRFWGRTLATILPRLADYLQMAQGRFADDWSDRYLRWLGSAYRRRPTMQMLLWGLTMLRCKHVPELERQAAAFEDYFHPLPFHLRGYLEGIGPALAARRRRREAEPTSLD